MVCPAQVLALSKQGCSSSNHVLSTQISASVCFQEATGVFSYPYYPTSEYSPTAAAACGTGALSDGYIKTQVIMRRVLM
jgi:hypothetical protein